MTEHATDPRPGLDEDVALRRILEGTAGETGEQFFVALVRNLVQRLEVYAAWVTEYLPEQRRLRALAFWFGDRFIPHFEYDVAGTPCESVINCARLIHFPDGLVQLFPHDDDLKKAHIASYMGAPMFDTDGRIIGNLGVMDTKPMQDVAPCQTLIRVFAARAAAEYRRLQAEAKVRERQEQLGRLLDSAMDSIVELDRDLRVTLINPAAEKVFGCNAATAVGKDFRPFLSDESARKLATLIGELGARPGGRQHFWIPAGLEARTAKGQMFPAEATLSRSEKDGAPFYTVILRDLNERVEAEQKIRALTDEAEYLRQEIKELHNFDEIIGQSQPLLRVLRDVKQVAQTDATVLLQGETGTGKELIARAIHSASRRHDKPLIKVNCAAIPATLIESEFFGHERGAFTGATGKREGRFALADKGTIFLDEVGEIPLDLQSKLLRVLQEGEFEPVGSSQTRKVNVRVIAATNRDLQQAVKDGKFRDDLYYRLNVFPIRIPPLRERLDDIPSLASSFVKRFAQQLGRKIEPLTASDVLRLKAYTWPGNVRELENVIERAVITAQNGRLNLDRALPEASAVSSPKPAATEEASDSIRTVAEMEALERMNIVRALEATNGRVAGDNGAARLLGMKPSTLSSRMKALGIKKA
jgi:PAS domain S-box-containing protein